MSYHIPVLGHFTFWAVSSGRKSLENIHNCDILLINCTFKQYFVLHVSFLKWLNWKEAAPDWRSIALSKCNTLESAHVNHTERTTETKGRSYRKTVKSKKQNKKNTQIQNYTTAHHQLCPSCTTPDPASCPVRST